MNKNAMWYSVIGSAEQWAITDFGSVERAQKVLQIDQFSNGFPALAWHQKFRSRADAYQFLKRCEILLAFHSGREGEWFTPTFTIKFNTL